MRKYHKKTDYVRMYKSWCKDLGEPIPHNVENIPTETLIYLIDRLLIKHDCLPFEIEEKESLIKNMKNEKKIQKLIRVLNGLSDEELAEIRPYVYSSYSSKVMCKYDVKIKSTPSKKILLLKRLRDLTGWGLRESVDYINRDSDEGDSFFQNLEPWETDLIVDMFSDIATVEKIARVRLHR